MSEIIPESNDRPDIVKAKARVFLMESLWRWFLGLVVAVILVLVVIDTLQGRAVRKELVSCGVEGGQCYERSQTRIQEAISRIYEQGLDRELITRQIIVLAAACAGDVRIQTADAIEECVNERLSKENRVNIPKVP